MLKEMYIIGWFTDENIIIWDIQTYKKRDLSL